ncbi:D-alanyl-D-alanine dipeptidase [Gloeomargarita lithophora Alchichica-D10]|uniref:D-alanyl-D-alanine dipeptidase n=1 Tax=Gloeomargarita lithophora Alchichica-D10 TaxID=1188229 RepID=A0A1J0A9A2_9CYAN|nr:M15 family metallopeptidase [Gloeomargarita lithophora]APB32502.1 D-alanyl-D-alanine dipeptidase [Gloeomargarita lithophora Alchichica-D10]
MGIPGLKPYRYHPIQEWGEPLVPIPGDQFTLTLPHPYAKLGAPYGNYSPFSLRQSVLIKLLQAQDYLQQIKPGWRLNIFDGYRPNTVQVFMVEYTYQELLKIQPEIAPTDLLAQVYQIWAVPSDEPATPPPHSTGAAVDLTLIDEYGQAVDMGSPIDECSPRSLPDYYPRESPYAIHRNLLHQTMIHAGFVRHPEEWWHFSWGDQLWAWVTGAPNAHYGRVEEN